MKVSPEIQSPSYFTSQGITLQEFPTIVRSFKFRENYYKLLKLWFVAAENIRDDIQHVVKTDVMRSPGTTSLGIISIGRGQIPFRGPTIWKSTGSRQGKSRVFKDFT
jgi:hypothetical protein